MITQPGDTIRVEYKRHFENYLKIDEVDEYAPIETLDSIFKSRGMNVLATCFDYDGTYFPPQPNSVNKNRLVKFTD